jgi:chloramphenicol 3-O-phosphotransferase
MRIGLSGPSGSGKTTIAKILAESLGIPFIPTSVENVLSEWQKEYLSQKYGYEAKGHKNVIQLSGANPEFAKEFQLMVKSGRAALLAEHESYIVDRTAIDNMAYYLSEGAAYDTYEQSVLFLMDVRDNLKALDVVFVIKAVQPSREVEDNNSRIPNWIYQKGVEGNFITAKNLIYDLESLDELQELPLVQTIGYWDLRTRQQDMLTRIAKRVEMKADFIKKVKMRTDEY